MKVWWFIGKEVGGSLVEMWWLISGDVVAHWYRFGGALVGMLWLIIGGDVVAHYWWRCGGSLQGWGCSC